MWIRVYEKESEYAGDDIENMTDYQIKYISSYQIDQFEIELKESGIYHIVLKCSHNDMPMGDKTKHGEYIYAQADNEKAILAKADALALALDKGSY